MAKTVEVNIKKSSELGENFDFTQIAKNFIPGINLDNPNIKIRIDSKFLPAYTLDLSPTQKKLKKGSILESMNPTATVLVGNKAYKLNPYGKKKIEYTDPLIFNNPTMLDRIMQFGLVNVMLVTLGIGAIGGYFIYKRLK